VKLQKYIQTYKMLLAEQRLLTVLTVRGLLVMEITLTAELREYLKE